MRNVPNHRYPSPGQVGGRLIREVIKSLREQKIALPIRSSILIAASAGSDSMALAHLLTKYGRRVIPSSKIRLIHINHGWRGKESDGDEKLVQQFAKKWRLKIKVIRLKPPVLKGTGESLEDIARSARKNAFNKNVPKKGYLFTAHHADDLAETMLWRLLTGSAASHGGGIVAKHGKELRPLLRVRKNELKNYLKEENQAWREDVTNHEGRFLRSRMRMELMPAVERLFPRAIEHLVHAALDAQRQDQKSACRIGPELLFSAAGLSARRAHWELLGDKMNRANWAGELHLPDGWRLTKKRLRSDASGKKRCVRVQWVLEKASL